MSGTYGATNIAEPYFDDPDAGAVNKSLEHLKSSIYKISGNATFLDQNTRLIGTARDGNSLRNKIHTLEQETNGIINQTLPFFSKVSSKSLDRRTKLLVERVTADFRFAVQRYQGFQKKAAERVRSTPLPRTTQYGDQGSANLVDFSSEGDDEQRLLNEQRRTQLQTQQLDIESDLQVIREREEQIRQLEDDIVDVNEIFRDLALLVHEQGETIDSIEQNIERTADNVEGGVTQLQKASTYQRKARKKMCILVVILVFVAGAIALIIYLSTK